MSQTSVIRLVKSLSKSEKRHFKLYTKRHSGNKDYLELFDLIDQSNFMDRKMLELEFWKMYPKASLDNTARYLIKLVTDSLIQSRTNEGDLFKLLHGLQRINIWIERNLPEEGYKELKRLQPIAIAAHQPFFQYILSRYELDYLAEINFHGISEKELVDIQMNARDALKNIRHTHEHHSLFELLKIRLIRSGKAVSEVDKKQLNDLLLSEMSIVNTKVKHNLESRKLHLLFQSYFFMDIGDYKSALKTFHELNRLFEKYNALWHHPPLDYLSSIDGILDSLRTIGYYKEMPFYIKKMDQLDDPAYPEYFRYIVRKSVMIYQLNFFRGTGEFELAIQFIQKGDLNLIKAYNLVDEEKQCELLFCIGLAYFNAGNLKKAQKYINEIVLVGKINYQFMIYRVSRLLNILIHYEENHLDHLDHEIRSYKRAFQNKGRNLKIESLFFKTVKCRPDINIIQKNELIWKKIKPSLMVIEKDKYESQLRKYFNFVEWIKGKFNTTR